MVADNKFFNPSIIIAGAVLIISISLLSGFLQMLTEFPQHLYKDFTAELQIHMYIAGWLLLFYGVYRLGKKRFLS